MVGPVRYSCMYPIGQSLNNLKQYVKDKTDPEVPRSTYLQGKETGSNRCEYDNDSCDRNKNSGELSVFGQNARLIGEPKSRQLSQKEMELAHWYILSHCDESKPYLKRHAGTLEPKGANDIHTMQELQFPNWIKNQAQTLHQEGNISDELHTLAIGPDRCANSYSGCTVNGLRFHTKDHDHGQTIQNSGISLPAFHGKLEVHLYGILCEVLELHYRNKRVLLLKCEWFDTNQRKSNIRNEKGFVSINISRRWYEDQPFILVNEAEQVFYVDD